MFTSFQKNKKFYEHFGWAKPILHVIKPCAKIARGASRFYKILYENKLRNVIGAVFFKSWKMACGNSAVSYWDI